MRLFIIFLLCLNLLAAGVSAKGQIRPSPSEITAYRGLHDAAHRGDVTRVRALLSAGADLELRDQAGRTALHVATFASNDEVVRLLAGAGADMNALEYQAYDVVTIAAVANDVEMVDLVLELGANPGNVTSPYDGTALIAAAHLGHHKVVERLVGAGAPVDHVNNLGWTALIEAVVLGDGGSDHVKVVRALLAGNADASLGDRSGRTPIELARLYGHTNIIALLEAYTSR